MPPRLPRNLSLHWVLSTNPAIRFPARTLSSIPTARTLTSIPTVHSLPPSTCPCRTTPSTTLEIDITTPLAGSSPNYTHHILLPTSLPPESWPSKIDLSNSAESEGLAIVANRLKKTLRKSTETGLVTSAYPPPPGAEEGSAVVLPEGRTFQTSAELEEWLALEGVARENIGKRLPESLKAVVLVCVHGTRDTRCGEMGQAVLDQFHDVCSAGQSIKELSTPLHPDTEAAGEPVRTGGIWVLGCSHLSGHKWAGNVIVYRRREEGGEGGPAEGEDEKGWWGVWYGRVTPKEVEGIVAETVQGGRVLGEETGVLRGVLGGTLEARVEGWEGQVAERN